MRAGPQRTVSPERISTGCHSGTDDAEIRAGERNHGGAFEVELAAGQRHFERRGVRRIAHQQIAGAQRQRVGRARCRDAEMRVAEAAEILHRGQEAGCDDVNAAHGRGSRTGMKRTRSPMRRSGGGDADRVEELQLGAADQAPSAGGSERINTGLRSADGDAAHRHVFARGCQSRRGQFGRQAAQVGKAGGEADEVDQVFRRRMQFHYARFGEAGMARHVAEVRTELAAVADGDFDVPRLGRRLA